MSEKDRLLPGSEASKPLKQQREGYACSFCDRSFTSLQALGGHQTAHRKEIEEMREEHKAMVESQKLDTGAAAVTFDFLGRWEEEEAGRRREGKIQDESPEDLNLDLNLKL